MIGLAVFCATHSLVCAKVAPVRTDVRSPGGIIRPFTGPAEAQVKRGHGVKNQLCVTR